MNAGSPTRRCTWRRRAATQGPWWGYSKVIFERPCQFLAKKPTKWLQERPNGSKNDLGMPPRRAFCGYNPFYCPIGHRPEPRGVDMKNQIPKIPITTPKPRAPTGERLRLGSRIQVSNFGFRGGWFGVYGLRFECRIRGFGSRF